MATRLHRVYVPITLALLATLLHPAARAGQLFFTTKPSLSPAEAVTASQTNPVLVIPTIGDTANLYLWAKVAPPTLASNPTRYVKTERFNSIGVDVVETTNIAHSPTFTVTNNIPRWDVPVGQSTGPSGLEFVGSGTLASIRRAAVTTLGIGGIIAGLTPPPPAGQAFDTDPADVIGTDGNVYEQIATIPVTRDTTGAASIFLRSNSLVVSYDAQTESNTFFGAGDASVPAYQGIGGIQSSLPDATIVPEPSVLVLSGLLAVFLSRSRRSVWSAG